MALASNPAYSAAIQGEGIALGGLRDARLFSNPEAELEAPGLGRSGSLDDYQLTIAQELEVAGQRGLRIRMAESGVGRARAEAIDAARLLSGGVSTAFIAAFAAEQRYGVIQDSRDVLQRLLEAVRARRSAGAVSDLEANLAEIEVGRARARLVHAEFDTQASRIALARSIGLTEDTPVRPIGPLPETPDVLDVGGLMADALARRPDLAARRMAVAESSSALDLSRRSAFPKLRIGLLAERTGPDQPTDMGAVVGMAIPLWNRNQGLIASRALELRRSQLETASLEIEVRAEVNRAYQAYRTAHVAADVLRKDVVQPARDNLDLIEIAYESGKIDLPSLLLIRNQLLDAELEYWDAWLEERRALVDLDIATGSFPLPQEKP